MGGGGDTPPIPPCSTMGERSEPLWKILYYDPKLYGSCCETLFILQYGPNIVWGIHPPPPCSMMGERSERGIHPPYPLFHDGRAKRAPRMYLQQNKIYFVYFERTLGMVFQEGASGDVSPGPKMTRLSMIIWLTNVFLMMLYIWHVSLVITMLLNGFFNNIRIYPVSKTGVGDTSGGYIPLTPCSTKGERSEPH